MVYFYSFLIIIVFFVITAIPLVIISEKRKQRKLEEVFAGRQELNEQSFYEKYFYGQGVPFFIVKKIREILEDVLGADLSRLSAGDDFSKNLNFFWQEDSLADVEILERIEEEFEINFNQADFDELETTSIENIVNVVWRKVREKEA
jgi:acyl carrier protein